MTSFTDTVETNSVQAPGGARVGSTSGTSFSSTGESTTQEYEMSELTQAGGPDDMLRSIQIAPSRSLQNGKTVASRGAGQSARMTFCWKLFVFYVLGMRTSGDVRISEFLTC